METQIENGVHSIPKMDNLPKMENVEFVKFAKVVNSWDFIYPFKKYDKWLFVIF